MQLADRYVIKGRIETAREIYTDVLVTTADEQRIIEARAGLQRCQQAEELEQDRKNLASRLEAAMPESQFEILNNSIKVQVMASEERQ